MKRNCSEDALSTVRQYVMQLLKANSTGMKLLTIIVVIWDDRNITLRRKNFTDVLKELQRYLISTIAGQTLHQHLVSQKNQL